jgi:hypothetical protein
MTTRDNINEILHILTRDLPYSPTTRTSRKDERTTTTFNHIFGASNPPVEKPVPWIRKIFTDPGSSRLYPDFTDPVLGSYNLSMIV